MRRQVTDMSIDRLQDRMVVRVSALEKALKEKGLAVDEHIENFRSTTEKEWTHHNGAKLVAKAWVDPDFKARLLDDGKIVAEELGFDFPPQQKHLVVLENTADVHNVICCSLCSCTAIALIGVAPRWYKDFEYRARIVREARTVLREMGLVLPESTDVRVWDTTSDTRFMVLPHRPAYTEGWDVDELERLITRDSLIGVQRLDPPYMAEVARAALKRI